MIIAVDFDECLHAKSKPLPGRRMGGPLEGAKEAMENWKQRGDTLIILTVMATNDGGKEAVEGWLKYYGFPYDEVTAIKPNADVFIDDKAIRHTSWPDTIKAVDEIRKD